MLSIKTKVTRSRKSGESDDETGVEKFADSIGSPPLHSYATMSNALRSSSTHNGQLPGPGDEAKTEENVAAELDFTAKKIEPTTHRRKSLLSLELGRTTEPPPNSEVDIQPKWTL